MHGCALSGLYRSVDAGRSWRAVPWAAGACAMPGPQVIAWPRGVLASVTSNLAACAPPATTFVTAAAGASTTRVAGSLAQAFATGLGVIAPGRLWALTDQSLLTTADRGRAWQVLWPSLRPAVAVGFASPERGIAIGSAVDPAAVLATTDRGRTWQALGRLRASGVTALDVASATLAYAADYVWPGRSPSAIVWRSRDGRRTWSAVTP